MSVATLDPTTAAVDMKAPGSLQVDKVNVYYRDSQALRDISMDVPAGTVVSLLGRNGVGKTTLLKSIMGLLPVRRGTITFSGQDITKAPAHRRSWSGIGYVPQGRGIFPYLSVYENMQIAAETKGGGGKEVIEEMLDLFPALKIYAKKSGGSLSGGQQQQLAIARALARRPSLLVLDEPTEGIQPNIVLEIQQTIQALAAKNLTILLVEQFLDFALEVGHSYYVMSHGTIVASGPTQGLDPESIKHYIAI